MSKNFNHHIQILYVLNPNPLAFRVELSRWQDQPACPYKPGTSGAFGHAAWIKATANVNWFAAWLACWLRLDVLRRNQHVLNTIKLLFMQTGTLFHYYIWANISMLHWLWHWRVVHPLSAAWHRRQNNK